METYEHNSAFPQDSEAPSGTVTPINRTQRRAVGTAAAGTAVLGAAAYALSRLEDGESSDGSGVSDGSGLEGDGTNGLNGGANDGTNGAGVLAVSASTLGGQSTEDPNAGKSGAFDSRSLDEMTFEEAFAAARHAMGKGHHFTWHGGMYNTFYTEELDAMSTTERLAFVNTLGLEPEAKPVHSEPVAHKSEHHEPRHHHKAHHNAPDLADARDHSPTIEPLTPHPMTVVPMALASTEVVPMNADQQNARNTDLITADNSTDQAGTISPEIESVDDHHERSADAQHADDSPDDDEQANFMY